MFVHEVIKGELIEVGIAVVAKAIGMDPHALRVLLEDEETITPELDKELAKYFGLNKGVFLELQRAD